MMRPKSISNAMVVGMRHYGSEQLPIGDTYQLEVEPDNTEDPNAVAIRDLQFPYLKRAYLNGDWAEQIQPILKHATKTTISVLLPANFIIGDECRGLQHPCRITMTCDGSKLFEVKKYLIDRNIVYVKNEA